LAPLRTHSLLRGFCTLLPPSFWLSPADPLGLTLSSSGSLSWPPVLPSTLSRSDFQFFEETEKRVRPHMFDAVSRKAGQ